MEKIIKITILMIISLFILTGCESTYYSISEQKFENTTDRFIVIRKWQDERGYLNYIVYDKETMVEYWKILEYQTAGITILLDAEGKPILYKGD